MKVKDEQTGKAIDIDEKHEELCESEVQPEQPQIQGLQLSGLPERVEDDREDEDDMNDATADLPAAIERTMEQAQRARHDAGIRSTGDLDLRHTAAAVAGTSGKTISSASLRERSIGVPSLCQFCQTISFTIVAWYVMASPVRIANRNEILLWPVTVIRGMVLPRL